MIMPLPWKKAKVARISQLVADLQSPKHGGSLVVETGFPNSLIDLFVKNRDRIKNKPPSKKKKTKTKKNNNSNPVEISDPAIIPPPPPDCVNSVCFWGPAVSRIESHGCRQNCAGDSDKDLFVDDQVGAVVENNHVRRSELSGVFVVILKILIAVVVAMATKKLVVGITLSAFVLLFIEYAGKRVVYYFESCSKKLANLKLLIRRVEIVDSESYAPIKEGLDFGDGTTDEIEIGESKTDLFVVVQDEEIRASKSEFCMLNRDIRCEFEEEMVIKKIVMVEEDEGGVGETIDHKKRRGSRSAKFKAKMMKKFAPNKFRDSNKEKNGIGREPELGSPEISSEDKLRICENQEIEIDDNSSWHSLSEQKQGETEEEEKVDEGGRNRSVEITMATTPIVREKMGIEKKMNSRSLILIMLILAGLVGGRIVALMITFVWLLLCLKSVGIRKRQSNAPMIRGILSKFSDE